MNPASTIKKSQKEALFFKEISLLFAAEKRDNPAVRDATITKTTLSRDKGVCTVYFYTPKEETVRDILNMLICYKPSLRKALAERINARYTPEIVFRFDKQYIKQKRIEELFEAVAQKDKMETQDS